jgi:hypothetical protein
MNDLLAVALRVVEAIEVQKIACCIIGGIAVQVHGEDRLTRVVDVSVLTGFDRDRSFVDAMLAQFKPRMDSAREFALRHRVLLLEESRVGIDIALAAFPYEEAAISRAASVEVSPGIRLPIASAEDLVVMKAFAGRPQDWTDIAGILIRNPGLDWDLVFLELEPLAALKEDTTLLARLRDIRLSG